MAPPLKSKSEKEITPSAKALNGLSIVMVGTAVQKIITFALNSMLVRRTHPGIFGVAAVQLELWLSTLLFFSREGVRLALLREKAVGLVRRKQFVYLSWCPAAILAAVVIVLCSLWGIDRMKGDTTSLSSSYIQFEDMSISVMLLYCLGAFCESCGEPWMNTYANNMSFAPKIAAETMGLCIRSIITFTSLVYLNYGVLGFGFAQLGYGITHLMVITAYSGSVKDEEGVPLKFTDYLPGLSQKPLIDKVPASFAMQATASSLLKHVLTEADKITLSITRSNEQQGVFAVANNYASLIARLAFAPLEETARVAFSKYAQELLSKNIERHEQSLEELTIFLTRLLQTVVAFGTVLVVFGPHYIRLAVGIFLAPQWRREETVQTLIAFCVYIFMLGLNGVSEAFLYSLLEGFSSINYTLGASTLVYIGANVLLLTYAPTMGTAGIVISGTIAYLTRVTANFYNIRIFFVANGVDTRPILAALRPNVWLLTALVASFAMCFESSSRFASGNKDVYAAVLHLATGCLCFIGVLSVAYVTSTKGQLRAMMNMVVREKEKAD